MVNFFVNLHESLPSSRPPALQRKRPDLMKKKSLKLIHAQNHLNPDPILVLVWTQAISRR